MTHRRGSVLAAASVLLMAPLAQGAGISIDFFGGGGPGTSTAMGSGDVAGAIPLSNWNSFTGATQATPQGLNDDTGAATGATVSWASNNTWNAFNDNTAGNARMMMGYIDTNDTSISTVSVANLPASLTSAPYAVFVYYDGNNGTEGRVGKYSISGATTGNATFWGQDSGTFSGAFVLGQSLLDPGLLVATPGDIDDEDAAVATVPSGNVMVFPGLTGNAFTLSAQASVSMGNTNRASINGLQIVPMSAVPEPASLAAAGVLALGLLRRRRRA